MVKQTQANTSAQSRMALLKQLREFLPAHTLIDDAETQKVYECDGLAAYTEMPMLVLIPETVEQIQKAMRLFNQHNIPVVARGAGTGLSAGATPHKNGVVLSLEKFKHILDIDPLARTARLQPGVRNAAISEAAAEHGLYYAPDPSSQISCSIGGNVAENAGGVHCLKYGLTVHNVIKINLLTVEGELLTLGNDGLDNYGADLLSLINGSEGMLGVITEVTVKLLPVPEKAQVILAGFDSIQTAADAVGSVIAKGLIPAGLEMMDAFAIQAVENFAHAGYPLDAKALLLCEIDGTLEEIDEYSEQIACLFKDLGASSVRVSQNEAERALFWKGRKSAFPAVGRLSPDYYCMDGTIPRSQLAYVLTEIEKLSSEYDLQVANIFHAGDGNLHPLILFDASVPGELERTEKFGSKILEMCVKAGGCITGEHGVGLEKIRQMVIQFSDSEVGQLLRVKTAFDVNGNLNPGKGIPALKRCQEYRALSQSQSQNTGVQGVL